MSSKRNKQKIIITGVILIIIIIFLIIGVFLPKITLDIKGKSVITVNYGSSYKDEGATAYVMNILGKQKIKVQKEGEVNFEKVGKYIITYTAKANGKKVSKTRVVSVVDKEKPTITVNGNAKLCKNSKAFDANAVASDNYDGDITSKIEYRLKNNKIYLRVKDSSNNTTEVESAFKYVDNEKPVLTLNGSSVIYLEVGEEYVENGATSKDICDGDLSKNIQISGEVNSNKVGKYTIKYESSDSLGNKAAIERTVYVEEENYNKVTDGTVYLTFDDGPGKFTAKILDILAQNNIKATFFVTGQFSGYYDLITREYNEGHTVGIHTFSHKWDIYDSVDTYLADFNKIEKIVYEKTGSHPQYFRFPGGTSNTVSRKHSEGIMTTLSKLMVEKGYTYFDWNVDSCDTCKDHSVNNIINTVKKSVKDNGNYIILMHDIKENTLEALPTVIDYLQKKGYVFKKIDETTPLRQFAPLN